MGRTTMRRIKLTPAFAFLFGLSLVAVPSFAMKKVAQSDLQFLKFGIGARSVGMGEAYTAMSGDPNCIYYNPAGTAFVNGLEMVFNHSQWIAGISYQSGVLAYNTGRYGTFSANYLGVNYGTFERTEVDAHAWEAYVSRGEFEVSEYALGLGYATQITDRFFIGGQIKYAYQNLGSSQIWENIGSVFEATKEVKNETDVVAYDFGTYYNSGYYNLTVAMAVQNFSNIPIPLNFRFGLAMDVNLLLFPSLAEHNLKIACDLLHPRDYSERMQLGTEYWYRQFFALRGGYRINYDEQSFTAGIGLKLSYMGTKLQFDYALNDFGVFGAIQRFTVGIGF